MSDVITATLMILGLVVTVLGGMMKFMFSRIVEIKTAQMEINSDLRQDMQNQDSDHRKSQRDLWQELRTMAKADGDQHAHMLERLGNLATRDEVKADLAAMELRITNMLRKEVQQR